MVDISNEIIAKAIEGDMSAFEEIYRSASGFVYSVALRVTGNRSDADEVTQDVFVKVHHSLRDFGFRSSLKTWIYRIAVNTAINHHKRLARHSDRRVDLETEMLPGQGREKIDEMSDKEEAERKVSVLLGSLDADQRACLVLREIEGLDYKEIARTLSINLNTVRSRLKRAREKLIGVAKGVS
jgi:RNA polymerase sigma-70 factor (ECF subfamily)